MKLWLIRHAKSSWANAGMADFDRPLNARGERDGPLMSAWLTKQSDPARWLWTSTARRAMQTADFVQQAFNVAAAQRLEIAELYHASPESLLDVVRQTPEGIESVALVAHNPGITYLTNLLAGERSTDNVPTFGVARFSCSAPWVDVQPSNCALDLLVSPKTIA